MFYQHLIRPLLFWLTRKDAETAHHLTMKLLAFASRHPALCEIIGSIWGTTPSRELERTVMGLRFPHPVGLAPGFDKNALAIHAFAQVFGFLEIGTVTKDPQIGNNRPRMFRLLQDEALVNAMGFNNDGAMRIGMRLQNSLCDRPLGVPLGISIGKNKDVPTSDIDAVIENHLLCLDGILYSADYIVLNCASPNTPELRKLLERETLGALVRAVQERKKHGRKLPVPLVVKLSPDMDWNQIDAALEVCEANGVSGIIATNTTLKREELKSPKRVEIGGLSGAPLFLRALEVVMHVRRSLPKMAIIASGGINSGDRALRMLHAGADLLQVYTALVYEGPGFVKRLLRDLHPSKFA